METKARVTGRKLLAYLQTLKKKIAILEIQLTYNWEDTSKRYPRRAS